MIYSLIEMAKAQEAVNSERLLHGSPGLFSRRVTTSGF